MEDGALWQVHGVLQCSIGAGRLCHQDKYNNRVAILCGCEPDGGRQAIAHNFRHYVTLPPDKTIAQC